MMRVRFSRSAARVALVAVLVMAAQAFAATGPDPGVLLQQAKDATGGKAWDSLRSQHSRVKFTSATEEGIIERWASTQTGRSRLQFEIGKDKGVVGYDGIAQWAMDPSGKVQVVTHADVAKLAANIAYRDRLAFWYTERGQGRIDYARSDSVDGVGYDVIRVTPDGGSPFELWISKTTHRIERLREAEPGVTRNEAYSDFRDVQGVKVPFAVVVTRGDPKLDERYTVELLEYNVPLDGIAFEAPR